jgi:hypothetical protein
MRQQNSRGVARNDRDHRRAQSQRTDEVWFWTELREKLDGIIEAWEDCGAVVGFGPGTDCEAMCAALLTLSVQTRDAAACISTRPPSLKS